MEIGCEAATAKTFTLTGSNFNPPVAVVVSGATGTQTLVTSASVARLASIALRPKLAAYDFGVIDLTLPHWRHTISDREPRCNRSAN